MAANRYPALNFDLGETADQPRDTVAGFAAANPSCPLKWAKRPKR